MKNRYILRWLAVFFMTSLAGFAVKNLFPSSKPQVKPGVAFAAQKFIPNRKVMESNPLNQAKTPISVSSERSSFTNELFTTAESLWERPIIEEPFARFHDWAERYINVPNSDKHALELEGMELVRARRATLAQLIEKDPERALELTVPLRVRQALPDSIVSQLEKNIDGKGRIAVLAALPQPGKENEVVPTFRTAALGEREFKAFVYGRRLGEPTRDNIPIHGIAVDNLLAVRENPLRILDPAEAAKTKVADPICAISGLSASINNDEIAADIGGQIVYLCGHLHAQDLNYRMSVSESGGPGTSPEGSQSPEPSTWTEGQKKVILIRVDFPDLAGEPFADSTGITLISNLNSFYMEMSYGRAGFVGNGAGSDFTPTFRMPQPAGWYGTNDYYNQLRTDARNAATAAGYVLSSYDRDVICMGAVPGFNWSGLAYVGAAGAWLRNSFGTGVAGHELGHNWGLNHANFWDTSSQSVIGPGTSVEYGDSFDTMGAASAGNNHFNARYKIYLNWLTTNDWLTVSSNGTYRIFAHDNPTSSGLRALRIVKNSSTNYWVELRQKFTSNKWLMSGAGLRWAQNGNERSQLLDTTPGSSNGKNDSCIVIGRTFSDQVTGIHITPVGKGGTSPESLDVVVNLGLFPSDQPPILALTASATNAAPGATVNFTANASDPDGDALAYYWDFGDGNFGTNSPAVSKSWSATGDYVVRCVVTDMKGQPASASIIIVIGTPTTYRMSGTVSTTNGPVQGARVYVSTTRMAYTDTDGTYTIVGLPAGTYTVAASLENFAITSAGFVNPVSVGPNATGIDFSAIYTTYTAPTITSQPLSQTLNPGTNVIFTVGSTGTTPLRYQWRFNGANIGGATASSYSKTNVQLADAGNYSVVISNVAGTVTSANAVLSINSPASISSPPQDLTVIVGSNAIFTVTAAGSSPLNYQWQFNGTNIAGGTASSYTRVNVQSADAGAYRVVVSNSLGYAISSSATLAVNYSLVANASYGGAVTKNPDLPGYPANSAVVLTASPTSVFPFTGWSGDANGTNNPLTVIMNANKVINANFTSPVPDLIIDNPAAIFTGAWTTDTTLADKYGADYRYVATSASGASATATFAPNIPTAGRYDLYLWFPAISKGSPAAQFLLSDSDGNTTNLISQSSGSSGWQLFVTAANFAQGTNGFVRLSNAGQGGKNVVADAVRWVYSENQLLPPSVTFGPEDQSILAGQNASFDVVVSGTRPLSCQWFRDGTALLDATNPSLIISNAQPADAGSYRVVVANQLGSVTSSVAMLTIVAPPGIEFQPQDEVVVAGQGASFHVTALGTAPLSYQWALNGAAIPGATDSTLNIGNAQPADTGAYTVTITNMAGSVTSAVATLTVNVPPIVSVPPQNQSVLAGQPAIFSVTATGTGPLAYQWLLNNVPIPGAVTSTLSVSNVQPADAGGYCVNVTNIVGSITSSVAALVVNVALTATATSGGTITKTPDQPVYMAGTPVTLTATSISAFPFAGWSGQVNGTNNPLTLVLTNNMVIIANFTSPVPDLIIDNPFATFTGTWTTDTTGTEKYGLDYRYTGTAQNNASTATFVPDINTAGLYDVYVWYPNISKASLAQFVISGSDGSSTNNIDESSGAGGWQLLSSSRSFGRGTNGFVRLTNVGVGGKNVVADAVRWAYSENQIGAPPLITAQPEALRVIEGNSATFTVVADGTAPLFYQWRFNATPLSGKTNAILVVPDVHLTNAGDYDVTISNLVSSIASLPATLVVSVRPMLSVVNVLTNGRQFTVTGTPGDQYTIEFSTNLINWNSGVTISNLGGTVQFTDIDSTNYSQRFYRCRLQ